MKSLKEFISENLENPTDPTVQENTGQINEDRDETNIDKTNENNENILNGSANTAKTD